MLGAEQQHKLNAIKIIKVEVKNGLVILIVASF
jgi:hypothetical protein